MISWCSSICALIATKLAARDCLMLSKQSAFEATSIFLRHSMYAHNPECARVPGQNRQLSADLGKGGIHLPDKLSLVLNVDLLPSVHGSSREGKHKLIGPRMMIFHLMTSGLVLLEEIKEDCFHLLGAERR